jgi:hypothetical protein
MRRVRFAGRDAATMETPACADAIGSGSGGADRHRAAHAISGRTDLAPFIDDRLRIEPIYKRCGVRHVRLRA